MSNAPDPSLPVIIQGGMGAAVSTWRLAKAVAERGQLGVVSGTAIERIVAARLQEGDQGGHLRRVLAHFPVPAVAQRVLAAWFRPEGLPAPGAYAPIPMFNTNSSVGLLELTVCAAYAEIALAKEGHSGPVGINLLEKIQLPTLPLIYGAMLAGVDWVLMGAGIPKDAPGHIAALAKHQPAILRLNLADGGHEAVPFDPGFLGATLPPLRKPRFLAVISTDILAVALSRSGGVDGFVVEGPTAGGHNAPPRGGTMDAMGQPVYGPRDKADLNRIKGLGLPFWLAGGYCSKADVEAAQALGAQGVQVGTPFAFCRESGLAEDLRLRTLAAVRTGGLAVFTDPRLSPTGFPFKSVPLAGTATALPADSRERRPCVLGYLRQAYRTPEGAVGFRCPAEPEATWAARGGDPAATAGRRCLCHGLMASAGHPNASPAGLELPIITAGDMLNDLPQRLPAAKGEYSAGDVLAALGV